MGDIQNNNPSFTNFSQGTKDGRIFVFGQPGVEVVFELSQRIAIKFIVLHGEHLVAIDARSNLTVFSMENMQKVAMHTIRGKVTCVESDPSLDWLLLGLADGTVDIWDMDRDCMSPYRIPNLYRERHDEWRRQRLPFAPSKSKIPFVASLQFHPRDVGTVLIGYPDGAVVYSFKTNSAEHYYELEIPPFAPGGGVYAETELEFTRRPRLLSAVYHPNGGQVLTAHIDGCLAFWNGTHNLPVQVRTVDSSDVNIPSRSRPHMVEREPITDIKWFCTENLEKTSIILSGGHPLGHFKGLTVFRFGDIASIAALAPELISRHYSYPQKQLLLPTRNEDVILICFLDTVSPFHGCGHAPGSVLAFLANGEIECFELTTGYPLKMSWELPAPLSWQSPRIEKANCVEISRHRWAQWAYENPSPSHMILKGGAPAKNNMRNFNHKLILLSGHKNGIVRLWDSSKGPDSGTMFEIDLLSAMQLKRGSRIQINEMSLSEKSGELAVGLDSGEVVIFRFGERDVTQLDEDFESLNIRGGELIENIQHTAIESQGFLPQCIVNLRRGAVTALKVSHLGFIAFGTESGLLAVIDMRGPAVIFMNELYSIHATKSTKKQGPVDVAEVVSSLTFSILSLHGDQHASLVLLTGTSAGRFIIHVIMPSANGGYEMVLNSSHTLLQHSAVINIMALASSSGEILDGDPELFGILSEGPSVPGFFAIAQKNYLSIHNGSSQKQTQKFNDRELLACEVVVRDRQSAVIACMTDNDRLSIFSLPELGRVSEVLLPNISNTMKLYSIVPNGELLVWTDNTECSLFTLWGRGVKYATLPHDSLFDALKSAPARPTISTYEWVTGTQYVSQKDLDLLIGGPDRPLSKRQKEQKMSSDRQQRLVNRSMASSRGQPSTAQPVANEMEDNQSYFSQIKQRLDERGERIQGVEETFSNLEERSSEWMKSISDFAEKQKRKALLKSVTKGFF